MTSPSLRPFIVERDADYLRLIKRALGKAGVPANAPLTAYDGDEAVQRLFDSEEPPSFVLLDLHLPRRSGLEVLGWIRCTPPHESVPVYILSVDASRESVSRALQLGVSSYLVKPNSVEDLEGLLAGIVDHESRRVSQRSMS